MLCNFCNLQTAEKQHQIWNRNKGQRKTVELCPSCWNIANGGQIKKNEDKKNGTNKKNEEKKNEKK